MSKTNHIAPDYMCLTHGQTVPLRPHSCEYDTEEDDPCIYAWVDLTPLDEHQAFLAAEWVHR